MSFPRPLQSYRSHADLIWPDGTLEVIVPMKIKPFTNQLFSATAEFPHSRANSTRG